MCKLCQESQAKGRRVADTMIAAAVVDLLCKRERGEIIEPEQFFSAFAARAVDYYDEMTRQFRADGRPPCPMEVNQA